MGRLGTMVDWSDMPRARGTMESGVQAVVDALPVDQDAPGSTRSLARTELPRPASVPSLSDTSLQALLTWLGDDSSSASVVAFVRGMLKRLAEVDSAVARLVDLTSTLSSEGARASAQSFAHAAHGWRLNLVDYVDELALTEHTSLVGWSSVPEYSSMLLLAFVAPPLATVRDYVGDAWAEGVDLDPAVRGVEVAIERLDAALARVRRSPSLAPGTVSNAVAW